MQNKEVTLEGLVGLLFGLTFGAILVLWFVFWSISSVVNLKAQVSNLASTTNSRLIPVEETSMEIENIVNGNTASSTKFINAVYNSNIVIMQLLQKSNSLTEK